MIGDTLEQALLRLNANENWNHPFVGIDPDRVYFDKIRQLIKSDNTLLDIGCGTGHILNGLKGFLKHSWIGIGLDASKAMIDIAIDNSCDDLIFIHGNCHSIDLENNSVDIVLSRLAEYSTTEIYRILKPEGYFIELGLGPLDSKEIALAFKDRFTCEYTELCDDWLRERELKIKSSGLLTKYFEIFNGVDHLSFKQLVDTIVMVPLVEDFNLEKDKNLLEQMKSGAVKGYPFEVSRQFTIRIAQKAENNES